MNSKYADVVLYLGTTCPCAKTNCINDGNKQSDIRFIIDKHKLIFYYN